MLRARVRLCAWLLLALALAAGASVTVAGATSAKKIVGSARAERLNGTAGPDVIYAGGGNDVIYGYGGNDRIYTGSGADKVYCGAGSDVVYGDARDTVARDCEVVRGVVAPKPPPKPPAPPPSPPPPPSKGPAPPGHYPGHSEQTGKDLSFDVTSDGAAVANLVLEYKASCDPGGDVPETARPPVRAPIGSDRSFVLRLSASGITLTFQGQFDSSTGTTAKGTLQIHRQFDQNGVHYECDTGTVVWDAARQ
jgi:Ca2+-binding RTX toxin-like protein